MLKQKITQIQAANADPSPGKREKPQQSPENVHDHAAISTTVAAVQAAIHQSVQMQREMLEEQFGARLPRPRFNDIQERSPEPVQQAQEPLASSALQNTAMGPAAEAPAKPIAAQQQYQQQEQHAEQPSQAPRFLSTAQKLKQQHQQHKEQPLPQTEESPAPASKQQAESSSINLDKEQLLKQIQELHAKLDDREDVIKMLARVIKKKDPTFNVAQIIGGRRISSKEEDDEEERPVQQQVDSSSDIKRRVMASQFVMQDPVRAKEVFESPIKKQMDARAAQGRPTSEQENDADEQRVAIRERQRQASISFNQPAEEPRRNSVRSQPEEQPREPSGYQPRFGPVGGERPPAKADAKNQPLSFDEFLRERARFAAKQELEQREPPDAEFEPPREANGNENAMRQLNEQLAEQKRMLQEQELKNKRAELELQQMRFQEQQRAFQATIAQQSGPSAVSPPQQTYQPQYQQPQPQYQPQQPQPYQQPQTQYQQPQQPARTQLPSQEDFYKQQQAAAPVSYAAQQSQQLAQNKSQQGSSDQIKAKLSLDTNNPRYRIYKDLDLAYTSLQVQAEQNKNELQQLYSRKITRKEQLRINFLEQRAKELDVDAAKMRTQLKAFEKEFQ